MDVNDFKRLIISQYIYYVLIGVVSFICLFFLPFLGSDVGMDWDLPTTTAGWAVYLVSKGIGAFVNVLVYHLFIRQAGLNIKDDERYLNALKAEGKLAVKEHKPLSPGRFFAIQYGFKGSTVFLISVASAVALTQAVLTFNWVQFLTYFFTLVLGVIFGIMEMKKVEFYWTVTYPEFVKYKENLSNGNS